MGKILEYPNLGGAPAQDDLLFLGDYSADNANPVTKHVLISDLNKKYQIWAADNNGLKITDDSGAYGLFVKDNGGSGLSNIGIGTNAASYLLDVQGSTVNNANIRIYSSVANSYPSLKLQNDATTWSIYCNGNYTDAVRTDIFLIEGPGGGSGPFRLFMQKNGNVGIGHNGSLAATGAEYDLDVKGDFCVKGSYPVIIDSARGEIKQLQTTGGVGTTNSFTILASETETGTGMSAQGSVSVNPYAIVGPTIQTIGYGWGTDAYSAGTWGTESSVSDVTLDPGNWSLSNFGQVLVATIHNGKTFTWDAGASSARSVRAASNTSGFSVTNNPTQSVMTIVSDRDRHLFHMGTETTIGTGSTQDPMFVRFSNQEDLNTYAPTATNTAGTFRLDDGNEIVTAVQGKDYILILTDTAAYVVQFVGPPFTFSVKQVGTNCGCISQHGAVYAQGAVYWMGKAGGFYVYDGTVKSLPCLVEDFVFTTDGDNLGINFGSSKTVYAGHNSLYTEVNWFYPKSESVQIDRCVTYNYAEGVWTTSSLDRTTYIDAGIRDNPYATDYVDNRTPDFPIQGITNTYGATFLYSHENGTDQVNADGTTSIDSFIRSGDYDITNTRDIADLRGDGQFFMSVRRFIPDFKVLQGNSKITLFINDYPNNTATSSPLGPFTVTSTTDKIDTRARGRLVSIKIANDSTGESWRYGTMRLDARPDGRR